MLQLIRDNVLGYLSMSVEDRIDWRYENEISMPELLDVLAPNVIEGDYVTANEFCNLMGITYTTFEKLLENGELNGTYPNQGQSKVKEWRIPANTANQFIRNEGLLIRQNDLITLFQEGGEIGCNDYPSASRALTSRFREMFFYTFSRDDLKVNFLDAQKIISTFRQIKRITETHFTLEDVIDAVDFGNARKTERQYIARQIDEGHINATMVSPPGEQYSLWMIPPKEYQRVVQERFELFNLLESNYTVAEAVAELGESAKVIRTHVNKGRIPVIPLSRKINQIKYVIAPHTISVLKNIKENGITLDQTAENLRQLGFPSHRLSEHVENLTSETYYLGRRMIMPEEFDEIAEMAYSDSKLRYYTEVNGGQLISIRNARKMLEEDNLPYYRIWEFLPEMDLQSVGGYPVLTHSQYELLADKVYQVSRKKKQDDRARFTTQVQGLDLDESVLAMDLGNDIEGVSASIEKDIWMLARAGDEIAFETLLNLYHPHILKIARNSIYGEIHLSDRIAFGAQGLYNALTNATNFDGNIRGYARRTIKMTIKNYCRAELGIQAWPDEIEDMDELAERAIVKE